MLIEFQKYICTVKEYVTDSNGHIAAYVKYCLFNIEYVKWITFLLQIDPMVQRMRGQICTVCRRVSY